MRGSHLLGLRLRPKADAVSRVGDGGACLGWGRRSGRTGTALSTFFSHSGALLRGHVFQISLNLLLLQGVLAGQVVLFLLLASFLLLHLLLQFALVLVLLLRLHLFHVYRDRIRDSRHSRPAGDHVPVLVSHGRSAASLTEATEEVAPGLDDVLMHPMDVAHVALGRAVDKLRRRCDCS